MMGGACDDDDVAESYIGEQKNKYREISGHNVLSDHTFLVI